MNAAPPDRHTLPARTILAFWTPLAATWLMMAVEGPYVAAIIARLPNPVVNLAAYGVAFSFGFIAEAPIIMMMTASNALVSDRQSYLALRRFMLVLNAVLTVAMAIGLLPPLFRFLTDDLIGLPPDIARRTNIATALLLFWPAAIGYRRFYQGILVRHKMPRRVAYGTVVRLGTMSVAAAGLAWWTDLDGAYVGSLALAGGVVAEAAASRWMARAIVARITAEPANTAPPGGGLSPHEILRFYVPLALTSLVAIAVNPLVTFFMGRSRMPLESLAVLPVVSGFVFMFRSGALAYQEVGVALVGAGREHEAPVRRVALALALASVAALAAVLFTPLAGVWFTRVAGLSPELARFALWPARLVALVPALDYLLSLQRALLVLDRRTRVITMATFTEACTIIVVLAVAVNSLHWVGALAASAALLAGRVAGNLFLLGPAAGRAGARELRMGN